MPGEQAGRGSNGSGSGGIFQFASGEAEVKATEGNAEGVFDQAVDEGGEIGGFGGVVFVVFGSGQWAVSSGQFGVCLLYLPFCLLHTACCLLSYPHFFGADAVEVKRQGVDFGLDLGQLLLGGGDGGGPGLGALAEGGTLDL